MDGTHKLNPHDVQVPENRFRPLKSEVEDIAQSIMENGQYQPIIVRKLDDGGYLLVDGLHRLTACQENGMDVEAVFTDEVDPIKLRQIELEVNIKRIAMTPFEEAEAIAQLHQLKLEQDPNWTQRETGEIIGKSAPTVSNAVKLTKMAEMFPELKKAKTLTQALSWMEHKAKSTMRVMDQADKKVDYSDIDEKILLGDSVELIKRVPDGQFDLVLTDPPFGIGYDRLKEGKNTESSTYEDSKVSYERLLGMAPDIYRVIKPDGWLIWFLGISWYEKAKEVFRDAGFIVDEVPIIWDRSQGHCYTQRPDRYFARGYDIALHCLKGDPQIVHRGKPNIIQVAPVEGKEKELVAERPVELYQELIRRLTVPKEVVADFFVGGGGVPAAAASMGRNYFGIELDPARRAYAIEKIKMHTPTGA